MAQIADLAAGIAAALNGHTFSAAFTASRAYLPIYELKDMDTFHVTVVPRGLEAVKASRAERQEDYRIDVAVQQRLSSLDNDTVDALMDLVEEIGDFLLDREIGGAVVDAVANDPIYAPEHMKDMRQFTSVLTCTLRQWR